MQLVSQKRKTIYRDNYTNSARSDEHDHIYRKNEKHNLNNLSYRNLVVQDKIIEQVSQFKYLGMDRHDLGSQINKASAMSACLRQIIWTNEYMQKDRKIRIQQGI